MRFLSQLRKTNRPPQEPSPLSKKICKDPIDCDYRIFNEAKSIKQEEIHIARFREKTVDIYPSRVCLGRYHEVLPKNWSI